MRFMLAVGVSLLCSTPAVAETWESAGASVYNGCSGAWGDVCGGAGFAELGGSGGVLLGGLAPGTLVRIRYGRRSVDVRKLDWGTGGGDVAGLSRAIDLPCSTAARLGIYDCTNWTGVVRWKRLVKVRRMRGWHVRKRRHHSLHAVRFPDPSTSSGSAAGQAAQSGHLEVADAAEAAGRPKPAGSGPDAQVRLAG